MKRYLTCLLPFVALAMLAATPACSSDDDDDDNPGTQGSAGASGKAGSGGTGGGAPGGSGGAGGGGGAAPLPPAKPAAYDVLALGKGSTLYYFKSDAPDVTKTGTVDGIDGLVAIDVRSSDGKLYGLASDGKLYSLDVDASGAELAITANGVDEAIDSDFAVGSGGVGFDFNPKSVVATDKGGDGGNALRVITNEENYRINPVNAKVLSPAEGDGDPSYDEGDPSEKAALIAGTAYLNAYKGTASTTIYYLDSNNKVLAQQSGDDPNLGKLATVGALGDAIDIADDQDAGFDIVTSSANDAVVNDAFIAYGTGFYSVNLGTGAATLVGQVAGADGLIGLAVMVQLP